jgi:hypothetical protein
VRCDQTGQPGVVQHHETAVAGAEEPLLHEILDVEVPVHRGTVGSHDIRPLSRLR